MSSVEIVRTLFAAYRAQDREAAEQVLADGLVFTSPQDDHLDRATYLRRCFPTANRFAAQEILRLAADGADGVFILYEYELQNGERYRNAEHLTIRDAQVIEIQVFFGGRV